MSLKSLMIGTALAVICATTASAETWNIAVTDVEGLERLQAEWGPFKVALEAATGETFEFFPVASRTASAEALRGETVDFVITGPAEYIVIWTPRLSLRRHRARRCGHRQHGRPEGQESGLW
jgi:phosphonate transport system substrate-binding protein